MYCRCLSGSAFKSEIKLICSNGDLSAVDGLFGMKLGFCIRYIGIGKCKMRKYRIRISRISLCLKLFQSFIPCKVNPYKMLGIIILICLITSLSLCYKVINVSGCLSAKIFLCI